MRALGVVIALVASAAAARADAAPCASSGCHADAMSSAPHAKLAGSHGKVACTGCHRGVESGTGPETAHPASGPDQLLKGPLVAASCASCHVAGAVPGMELLVRGAEVYAEAGCQLCHRALGWGHPAAFGPPLDSAGMRGTPYLSEVLRSPASIYKGTAMPSYATLLQDKSRADALLAYLLSLRGDPHPTPAGDVKAPCTSCHASLASPKGPPHRCRRILDRKNEMTCKRCHLKVPQGSSCLYITQVSKDCAACHTVGG